jgi:hypothetical protein
VKDRAPRARWGYSIYLVTGYEMMDKGNQRGLQMVSPIVYYT